MHEVQRNRDGPRRDIYQERSDDDFDLVSIRQGSENGVKIWKCFEVTEDGMAERSNGV